MLTSDVPAMLTEGISDGDVMRGELQGTGQAAAAVRMEADGLPMEMLGRMPTMVNRHTWQAAVADVDVVTEEPEKRGFTRAAASVRAGIAACRDDGDHGRFARWLADVYTLLAVAARG